MDNYLKSSNKIRIPIKGDGHCLPRTIFHGAKNLNLIPHFITYSALFKAAVEKIKSNINLYTSFLTESVESALEDLDSYLEDKQYSLNSNIVDVVIYALATETSCQIKIHYQEHDKSFDTNLINPENAHAVSKRIIEVAFINGHYDLVIKKIVKQELVAPATDTSAVQISQGLSISDEAICAFDITANIARIIYIR